MEARICADGLVHFRGFRFDLETHELYKDGREVRIRGHPAQILVLLLEHPGKVVARDTLRKALWPDHTFVDFEHILNNSINHLREALGDDAASPRFIQTVPGLGYRFIARLEGPAQNKPSLPPHRSADPMTATDRMPHGPAVEPVPHSWLRTRWMYITRTISRHFARGSRRRFTTGSIPL